MRRLAAVIVLMLVAASFVLRAQDAGPSAEPAAEIAVRDSGLLTFASGGDYLVVANGSELELYNVTEAGRPRDVVTFPLDSAPLALTATIDFALAAVRADGADSILVIAPDKYSRGGFGIVNVLDVPSGTHLIALSPDKQWALASGDDAYVTMSLNAADNIEISAPFDAGSTPVIGAALTNDRALLIYQASSSVAAAPLSTSSRIRPQPDAIRLDAAAVAIAVSDDAALGVVALADNRLTLFDPATLKIVRTLTLEDGPVVELRFLTSGERRILALRIAGRSAIMLLDVSEADAVSLPGSLAVEGLARGLSAAGDTLAVSGEAGVQLFRIADAG